MDTAADRLSNTCGFDNVKPVMVNYPYPEIKVNAPNITYANLLSVCYCGSISEMSSIMQYINNENRLSCARCSIAKSLLGMAMAEMTHMQKLGELIFLLGGEVDFVAKLPNGRTKMWTPSCLDIPDNLENMLQADMEIETGTISQYRDYMRIIKDDDVNAVLERIIMDEEYHIAILQALLEEI